MVGAEAAKQCNGGSLFQYCFCLNAYPTFRRILIMQEANQLKRLLIYASYK